MLTRQISLSAPIFLFIFVFQEAVVNQFKLPGGGFSLFIIFALVWAVISTPEIAALTGFGAGILMDMSGGAGGPVGQWTLIMIIICYGVSYLGYGDGNINGNPIGVVFFVVVANLATSFLFLSTSFIGCYNRKLRTNPSHTPWQFTLDFGAHTNCFACVFFHAQLCL